MELPPITCNKYRSLRQYRKKFTNHLNHKYTFTLTKEIESHSRKSLNIIKKNFCP